MTGHGAKFERKREAAIAALLTHRNYEEAARAIGLAPKTLYRWMKEPEFKARFRKAQSDVYFEAIGELKQASRAAAKTLLKTMLEPSTPPSAKLRAVDSVLGHVAKAIELEEFESRLSKLERAAEETEKR